MFKILSLDGGGIRGIITAYWLDILRQELKRPLCECFDLIAGTSTGAILASAVACDIVRDDDSYVDFYKEHGPKIFKPRPLVRDPWQPPAYLSPTYELDNLKLALMKVFSQSFKLGDAKTNLFIPSYDVFVRQTLWFKSYDVKMKNIPIWEACLSSSAAPAYFSANIINFERAEKVLIDGGVVANNPSACALAESITINDHQSFYDAQIFLASLGTGNLIRPIDKKDAQNWGGIQWIRPIIDVIFDGSSASVDFICRQILPNDSYIRLQVDLRGASDDLDNVEEENLDNLIRVASGYVNGDEGSDKIQQILSALQ